MRRTSTLTALAFLLAASLPCASAFAQRAPDADRYAPLGAPSRFQPAIAENGMVAAQQKVAAEVGAEILRQGGDAVDAAVATGFALAVVHPNAGNLGGGGFMVLALANPQKLTAIDFRETAPAAASKDMYLNARGEVDIEKIRYSFAAAGVPGSVAGLTYALSHYGTMPLARVLAPAIRLAEEGFAVTHGLARNFARSRDRLARDAAAASFFLHADGQPYRAGEVLRQPELAGTLRAIAAQGAAGFYDGPIAERIAASMQANGGLITREDLRAYRVVERVPARGTFRGYDIGRCGHPPPAACISSKC